MHTLDKIDAVVALLRRVDAGMALVYQAGPDAQLVHVMEMTGMMREKVGQALSILEDEDGFESDATGSEAGGPALAQPAQVPAQGRAAVVSFRTPQRS